MKFFFKANSYSAPFCSDTSTGFITACDAEEALEKAVQNYSHPAGLYALGIWQDANACENNDTPLKVWLSAKAIKDKRR